MIIEIKSTLLEIINKVFGELNIKSAPILERPKDRTMGDVAIPCFSYAQEKRQSPNLIAQAIKEKLTGELLAEVEAIGGYVNLFLNKEKVTNDVLRSIFTEQENYGSQKMGEGKTVVLDYSSPNIAKPFGVGHLRSTVIGNAIRKILDKLGYTTVGINHLGDYGTQFGKIIWAYKKWGNEEAIK
ncbi:MAG: arginine--tRNA ligase, partial [Bacilli bacterium]|nr:arginine--tRNA ligase [Bacilli bacterium]